MGSASAPILGLLLDKLGMVKFYAILNVSIIGFSALFALPYFSAQLTSFVFGLVYFKYVLDVIAYWFLILFIYLYIIIFILTLISSVPGPR